MAYKARRTRDLQGEVQAGTGMSVTVQIKPDGTKEYTINNIAPGGEIPVSRWELSVSYDTNQSILYCDDIDEEVINSDIYSKGEVAAWGNTCYGVSVNSSGIYFVSVHAEFEIETISNPTQSNGNKLHIGYYSGDDSWNEVVTLGCNLSEIDTNHYLVKYDYSGYFNFDANSIISIIAEYPELSGNVINIGTPQYNPSLSIQKIQ